MASRSSSELINKIPPQSIEAEQSALGSMMIETPAVLKARQILKASDFYRPAHQSIFEAICSLVDNEYPVDLVTVQDELRSRGKLDAVGGTEYLIALFDAVPTASNVEYYCNIVRDKSEKRELISALHTAIGEVFESETAQKARDKAADLLLRVESSNTHSNHDWAEEVESTLSDIMQLCDYGGLDPKIRTGLKSFDRYTIMSDGLIVFGGEPGRGKTSAVLQVIRASRVTKADPILLLSLETTRKNIIRRQLSSAARVDLMKIRRGVLLDHEKGLLGAHACELKELPIICEDNVYDLASIVSMIKFKLLSKNISAVIIDYAQLIECKAESERVRCNIISRTLSKLGLQHGIPIIALVQLNRDVAKRAGVNEDRDLNLSRPIPSDIKESGQFYQDAQLLMLINNPPVKLKDGETEADLGPVEAEFCYLKQKDGPTGIAKVMWNASTLTFTDCY